jgi:phosphomannomutase
VSQLIINVSGLRGVIGATLNPQVAMRYAAAFAEHAPPGPLLVARDSRPSGRLLAAAVEAALCGLGRDVLRAGIAATPSVGLLVRAHQTAGALQISASHNPPPYNGIKLFGADGRVLSAGVGAQVADTYRAQQPILWCGHAALGAARDLPDTLSLHLQRVLETVDAESIRGRRFHVLLDSNHGAGSLLGRPLLEKLGCRVTLVGEPPDGQFAHPPEPTAENLASVGQQVVACGADIGFCQDPDADRLAVIDEQGRYIGEEFTLALCVQHRLQHATGPIVTNCATSRMSQALAEQSGSRFVRSAVGEANVTDAMLASQAVYGGEGNGGPIDPRVGYVRDSFVGMAQILDAMAATEQPISGLAAALPQYAIHKTTVRLEPEQLDSALTALQQHFGDATSDRMDGLRLDWPDKWLLVRGSNTEPLVRVIAEAPTLDEARQLCAAAGKKLETPA